MSIILSNFSSIALKLRSVHKKKVHTQLHNINTLVGVGNFFTLIYTNCHEIRNISIWS